MCSRVTRVHGCAREAIAACSDAYSVRFVNPRREAVEPREGLDRVDADELLVDVHATQLRLCNARLLHDAEQPIKIADAG